MGGAQSHMLLQVGLTMCGKLLILDRTSGTAEELEEQRRNGTDLNEDQFALLQPVSFIVCPGKIE